MNSILQKKDDTRCFICMLEGRYIQRGVHWHHIFGAANRKWSEKYGLKVRLCLYHHTGSAKAVHMNKEVDLRLKKIGQCMFEMFYPDLNFLSIFGRNYLFPNEHPGTLKLDESDGLSGITFLEEADEDD